jgi:hypothetical protein
MAMMGRPDFEEGRGISIEPGRKSIGMRRGQFGIPFPAICAIIDPSTTRSRRLQKQVEREWDLTIDPDTVRLFIGKAKALSAAVNDDYADGVDREVEHDGDAADTHMHDGLAEEEEEDLTEEELRELIADLNVDEAAELIALAWLGRGDYEPGEWQDAVAEARQRGRRKTATYLLGLPMLADYLEEGLQAIGA